MNVSKFYNVDQKPASGAEYFASKQDEEVWLLAIPLQGSVYSFYLSLKLNFVKFLFKVLLYFEIL